MIQFTNKATTIPNGDESAEYTDLVRACIANQGVKGFTVSEMRSRIAILDKLDLCSEVDQVIEFSPEEFETLSTSVGEKSWPIIHADIVGFSDYIEGLTDA